MENDNAAPVIFEPDYSLKQKLGPQASLEEVLTPQIVENAQKTASALEPQILNAVLNDVGRMKAAMTPLTPSSIPILVETAFAIKSKAGLCNYSLASALAKSLHVFCESLTPGATLGSKETEIIHCLVKALNTVFDLKVTGNGGKTGEAITAELKRLALRFS